MSITHGKATHLVGLKPSPSKLINKAQLGLAGPHTQIQQIGKHVNYSAEFQQKKEQLELPPIKPQLV